MQGEYLTRNVAFVVKKAFGIQSLASTQKKNSVTYPNKSSPKNTTEIQLCLPLIINFPDVLLSSASNMYLPSSSYLADFTKRLCLFPSTWSSNLSSVDNSWDPFSQRKLLGSREISSSNFASSFSYTCTSARGVMNDTGTSVDSDR